MWINQITRKIIEKSIRVREMHDWPADRFDSGNIQTHTRTHTFKTVTRGLHRICLYSKNAKLVAWENEDDDVVDERDE